MKGCLLSVVTSVASADASSNRAASCLRRRSDAVRRRYVLLPPDAGDDDVGVVVVGAAGVACCRGGRPAVASVTSARAVDAPMMVLPMTSAGDGCRDRVGAAGGLIEPRCGAGAPGRRGRRAGPVETMLRMHLLQVRFCLSDEGAQDAVRGSCAMCRFMGLDSAVEQKRGATTMLHFRHLLKKHGLGRALFDEQNEVFAEQGWIMRGGSIVDATIIAAPSWRRNASGARDPQMHRTRKGDQWYVGMKARIGGDAGTG